MKKLTWELMKYGPILVGLVMMGEALAAQKKFRAKCETPQSLHQFTITNNVVTLQKGSERNETRNPASSAINSRTNYTMKGFKKYFRHSDHRYLINIENTSSLSAIDDFVVIQNNKGHEITYPLECNTY